DWCNPRNVLQVLRRVRNVKNKNIIFYYESKKSKDIYEQLYPEVYNNKDVYDKLKWADRLEKASSSREDFYELCKLNKIRISVNELSKEQLKDLEDLIKFDENDDYRIKYESIPDITENVLRDLRELYEEGKISITQKYMIE